jgi:hypothetical protein
MKCLDGELLETQYEWPASVGVDECNEETLMRTNEMSGGEMVEKTKSYLKKNSVACILMVCFYIRMGTWYYLSYLNFCFGGSARNILVLPFKSKIKNKLR